MRNNNIDAIEYCIPYTIGGAKAFFLFILAKTFLGRLLSPRHPERSADLTTYIAEEVTYMGEGEISRHRMNAFVVTSH